MMNQFGGSKYSWKPSGCVCYSATPIGGGRVGQALRPYLAELGCLSVSKQLVLQSANKIFNEDGTFADGENGFITKQTEGFLNQVAWWAEACQEQRKKGTP
jgi:NAD(P)H-dependent FMN reductase